MIKLKGGYAAIIDGQDVVLQGIHKFPEEIKKDLIKREFAEEISEDDITPKELTKVRTIFLVDGKLTEIEPKVGEPKDTIYTRESIADLKVADLEILAKEKGIELKGKDKAEKIEEICAALGL